MQEAPVRGSGRCPAKILLSSLKNSWRKSTLQLTVDRLTPNFKIQNVTSQREKDIKDVILNHVSKIPKENFIFEPQSRDVGPAVGLSMAVIGKKHPDAPVAILWSDHFVKRKDGLGKS